MSCFKIVLAQYACQSLSGVADFVINMEYWIAAAAAYQPDLVVFPEYFNLALCPATIGIDTVVALRELAQHTPYIVDQLSVYAQRYQTTIIGGTLLEASNEQLYNTAYCCLPDGTHQKYRKTHLTPFERTWQLSAGDALSIWQIGGYRIGILICYDVEFPEMARQLALQGMDILVVPYQTDTPAGFERVRRCAAARAVENECYVAACGLVGNLPLHHFVGFQYGGQSTIFSPSDVFFMPSGIVATAPLNEAALVYAELDIALLQRLHQSGSVRTLTDRRTDLYR